MWSQTVAPASRRWVLNGAKDELRKDVGGDTAELYEEGR
jgi:hypothetical protein